MTQPAAPSLKCVVTGDVAVGKTCLLISCTTNDFQDGFVPTLFQECSVDIIVDDKQISLGLWEAVSHERFHRMRPIVYQQTDVFVICFSVVSSVSFGKVKSQWYPEINHYAPNTPTILVGTKLDLREDTATLDSLRLKGLEPISYKQGLSCAIDIGAFKYIECSALTQENVKSVFDEAVSAILSKPKGSQCLIL